MSNPTTRGKYKLLQLGEGLNSWGLSSGLNGGVFERLDEAVHGVQEITLTSTSYTLTTTNYVENDIRYRILSFSGNFAATISIPASTENWWIIKNSTGQILTFSNGSNSATIGVGFYGLVHTNGTTVVSLTLPDGVSAKTVADNIASVNQVATDSASVIAVAGKSTEVGRLGTTAAVADLAALGGTSEVANLATLAPRAADIGTLAPRASDIQSLAPREADLNTLSPRAADIGTLAPRASDLQALAPREADLNTLSPRASDLQTLSPRAADIGTLADVQDGTTATNALSTLAPISAAITGVNAISSAVTGVNNISSAVSGVNSIASDVTAVNTDPLKSNINTTAGAVTNVNNVGTNIASVNSVSSNMASVNSFGNTYQISTNNPTTGGDGSSALADGMLSWVTSADKLRVYNATSGAWEDAGSAVNGTSARFSYTATANQTTFPSSGSISYDANFADVYLNGIKLQNGTDVNVTSGTNVVLASGAAVGDIVDIVAYGSFNVANTYTQAQTNTLLADKAPLASPNFSGTPQIGGSNILTSATIPASETNLLHSFTASEAIDIRKAVSVKANGQIEKLFINPQGGTTAAEFTSTLIRIEGNNVNNQNKTVCSYWDANASRAVIFFVDKNNNDRLIGQVFTASGTALTSGGTPVVIDAGDCFHISCVYMGHANKGLVAYRDGAAGNYIVARSITVDPSDNSLTFGAEATGSATQYGVGTQTTCVYDPTNDLAIVSWWSGSGNLGWSASCSISGTTLTFSGIESFTAGSTGNYSLASCFDENANCILHAFADVSNNYYGTAKAGKYFSGYSNPYQYGNTSSNQNVLVFQTSAVSWIDIAYNSTSQNCVVVFEQQSNGNGEARVLTPSYSSNSPTAGSVSSGGVINVHPGSDSIRELSITDHPITGKMLLSYRNVSDGSLEMKAITVTGTTPTQTAETVVETGILPTQVKNVYIPTVEKTLVVYRNHVTETGRYSLLQTQTTNSANYIGIANEAISSGQTGNVVVGGGLVKGLTSLTPLTDYYVQADGTISATTTAPAFKIGKAVDTTSVLTIGES